MSIVSFIPPYNLLIILRFSERKAEHSQSDEASWLPSSHNTESHSENQVGLLPLPTFQAEKKHRPGLGVRAAQGAERLQGAAAARTFPAQGRVLKDRVEWEQVLDYTAD